MTVDKQVILAPSWLGKIDWSKGLPLSNISSHQANNIEHHNEYVVDYWADWLSPAYNDTLEYRKSFPIYNKSYDYDEYDELSNVIEPLYRHFLKREDFYKFYINKYNARLLKLFNNDNIIPNIKLKLKKQNILICNTNYINDDGNINDIILDEDVEDNNDYDTWDNDNNDNNNDKTYSDYEDYEM
jgi:hypothetical protein